MKAMEYEYLLRTVYNCETDYSNGADADIYRKLEHSITEYDTQMNFAKVRRHTRDAIVAGIERIKSPTNQSDIAKLNEMTTTLDHRFFDREKLDDIIEEAGDIFRANGLKME